MKQSTLKLAAVIADAASAARMSTDWRAGCDGAREFIARYFAILDVPQSQRAEFMKLCGLED